MNENLEEMIQKKKEQHQKMNKEGMFWIQKLVIKKFFHLELNLGRKKDYVK